MRRCHLFAPVGRSALLRQPRRLYRRERPQGEPPQAAGDHGFGRRQPPLHPQRSATRDQPAFPARLHEDRLRPLFEPSRPRLHFRSPGRHPPARPRTLYPAPPPPLAPPRPPHPFLPLASPAAPPLTTH